MMRPVLAVFAFVLLWAMASAAPMPKPIANAATTVRRSIPAEHTPAPRSLPSTSAPNDVYEFYRPLERWVQGRLQVGDRSLHPGEDEWSGARKEARDLAAAATRVNRRSDVPSVPLSQMPYPSFPAQYPSCYNCEQQYPSLSSCMEASSVFQNASSIFNSPWSYISVIKCACTDTFQAVYPQCVQCFQMTNQCQYLGTDPVGTGAPEIVTNIRSICAFGSSLLGGAEHANYPDYNNTFTPSTVPGYTDVTTSGEGYYDQSTGAIFGGAMQTTAPAALPYLLSCVAVTLASLFVL